MGIPAASKASELDSDELEDLLLVFFAGGLTSKGEAGVTLLFRPVEGATHETSTGYKHAHLCARYTYVCTMYIYA